MDSTFPLPISGLEQFIGLEAQADTVAFTMGGSDWMDVSTQNVELTLNDNRGTWPGGLGPAVIDWGATAWGDGDETAGLQIPTGATNADGSDAVMTLAMDGNQRRAISIEQVCRACDDLLSRGLSKSRVA